MLTARRRRTDQGRVGLTAFGSTVYEALAAFDTLMDAFGDSRSCPSLPCGHLSPQMRGESIEAPPTIFNYGHFLTYAGSKRRQVGLWAVAVGRVRSCCAPRCSWGAAMAHGSLGHPLNCN